jgi:phosphoserine phosphatase
VPPPFAAVYFDCDSTLSSIEGVDELLQFVESKQRADIVELTRKAMDGLLPLAEVYETRLRLIAPRSDQLDRIGELYVENVVLHAREVVRALQHLGKHVGILSGGLLVAVEALARYLGIPLANVHAVPLLFDSHGDYFDFDRTKPLWRNGGKVEMVRRLPKDHRPVAFVGDSVTDLETQGHVDLFVGFGGVVTRAMVAENAEAFVDGKSLAPVLAHVLTEEERMLLAANGAFAQVLEAARG